MNTQRSDSDQFYAQINTLRLIAVAFVLSDHWIHGLSERLGIHGSYGVQLFFAISGFLITNILLSYKTRTESKQATFGSALAVFYARRSLRIFPAYYVLLAVAMIAGPAAVSSGIFWHAAYLSNFYFMDLGKFETLGHLWSLAVEEQFYLVWPLVVLMAPRRLLTPVVILGVSAAVLFRIVAVSLGWGLAAYISPLACLDTLGLGALLALLQTSTRGDSHVKLLNHVGIAALMIWPFVGFAGQELRTIAAPLIVGFASLFLITQCVRGIEGPVGKLFRFPPFLYLGKISYGLYLYHAVAAWIVPEYIGIGTQGGQIAQLASALVRLIVTILIAMISWHLIERPFGRLKRHFTLSKNSEPNRRVAPQPAPEPASNQNSLQTEAV